MDHDEYTQDELLAKLTELGYDPRFQDYYRNCIPFHTYPAPGMLIAIGMVDYALELIEAKPGEKVFAVCETQKCAPDPLQIIAHCTIGNNRLKIVPIGRFAITMNRPTLGDSAEGVRVFMDPVKLAAWPTLEKWFANSPEFSKKTMAKALQDEILKSKRSILSVQKVKVPVKQKEKWRSAVCKTCGEAIPEYLIEGDHCAGCGSLRYYDLL
ncbi:MAG: FmdE family protein [Methanospirillum sp.]|uniref:FmdE family protein n=1 Tax=Methanospirillum sp. TaxID=45200 RepID=UPI002369F17E|nr:FmdE family protein [Methanospirillum sp.]MDD1728651.1 FmdE family protein [Methanospirillum sp.]